MNGIILINKEKGCTSHDVVYKVKKLTNSKVGHTGTLDPNATGVLPLLIGEATKISKYLINHDKEYEVVLELGKKTSTADVEGEVIEEKEVPAKSLEEQYVKEIFKTFIGKQEQTPPIYSAIKINGKKLYEYARKGQEVKLEPRQIEIYDIELLNINKTEKQISFRVQCSKGTYIRSLCEDIAEKLGTVGLMKELKRTVVGDFKIENAITVEELKEKIENIPNKKEELEEKIENKDYSCIISIEEIFKHNNRIELNTQDYSKYVNGVKLDIENCKITEFDVTRRNVKEETQKNNLTDETYRIYLDNKFIGLGIVSENKLKRDLIIQD